MVDEELASRLIEWTRNMQEQGADIESISGALFGLGILISIERAGVEAAAAHIHLLADRIAPASVATIN